MTREIACTGCGEEGASKKAWVRTPLGNAVVHAHPGCEWAAMEKMEEMSGGKVKVIPEPLNDDDRARRAQEEAAT